MSDNIALIDMDDTLFEYSGTLLRDLEKLQGPNEEPVADLFNETRPYIKARSLAIRSVPGWWENLPKSEQGWEILAVLQEIGYVCHILTKANFKKPWVWEEKIRCLRRHLGTNDDVHVTMVSDSKRNVYGRVLVDDHPRFLTEWLEKRPRGIGIMPARPHNEEFEHDRVHRYTVSNLSEVRLVLEEHFRNGLRANG